MNVHMAKPPIFSKTIRLWADIRCGRTRCTSRRQLLFHQRHPCLEWGASRSLGHGIFRISWLPPWLLLPTPEGSVSRACRARQNLVCRSVSCPKLAYRERPCYQAAFDWIAATPLCIAAYKFFIASSFCNTSIAPACCIASTL